MLTFREEAIVLIPTKRAAAEGLVATTLNTYPGFSFEVKVITLKTSP